MVFSLTYKKRSLDSITKKSWSRKLFHGSQPEARYKKQGMNILNFTDVRFEKGPRKSHLHQF